MDKQEEDQAQEDEGQAETEAPGESGGQGDEVTTQDFIPEDYWEVRGLYIYRVHKKMRTKTFAPTECDDAPPVPLQNLEVYRTTIPDKIFGLSQHEDYWIGHPDDEVIFKKTANGAAILWTGKTRFERVCPEKIPSTDTTRSG